MAARFSALLEFIGWVRASVLGALRFNQCTMSLPWFSFGRDEMARLHRLTLSLIWIMVPSKSARIALWCSAAVWPVRALVAAVVLVCRHGGAVAQSRGVTRRSQLRRMLWLANRHNIAPHSFYEFRLWDDSHADTTLLYLQDLELAVLQLWLNLHREPGPLDDKESLFEKARADGLPTAPVVATFKAGTDRWHEGQAGVWPACDLFAKWANLYGGAGAENWSYDEDTVVWRLGREQLDGDGLVRRFRERSMTRKVVIQRRLHNHPDTARFSLGGLCTLRVVTYRPHGERAKVGFLCLRMPIGASIVDNLAAGGLAAAVDPDTGILGPAVGKATMVGSVSHHPDTGVRIGGEKLASWRELVDLALRAHDSFLDPWSIGWDVAMTPSGPVLVEGNSLWGGDIVQMTQGPIGGTAVARALCAEVSRCQGAEA